MGLTLRLDTAEHVIRSVGDHPGIVCIRDDDTATTFIIDPGWEPPHPDAGGDSGVFVSPIAGTEESAARQTIAEVAELVEAADGETAAWLWECACVGLQMAAELTRRSGDINVLDRHVILLRETHEALREKLQRDGF